jgi:hypothetical protein
MVRSSVQHTAEKNTVKTSLSTSDTHIAISAKETHNAPETKKFQLNICFCSNINLSKFTSLAKLHVAFRHLSRISHA